MHGVAPAASGDAGAQRIHARESAPLGSLFRSAQQRGKERGSFERSLDNVIHVIHRGLHFYPLAALVVDVFELGVDLLKLLEPPL
eukprot:2494702-Pyramimonas_sp.AAC.1